MDEVKKIRVSEYDALPIFSSEKAINEEIYAQGLYDMVQALWDLRAVVMYSPDEDLTEAARNRLLQQLHSIEYALFIPIENLRQDLRAQKN